MNRRDILSSLMALPAVAAVKAAPEVIDREPMLAEATEAPPAPMQSHPIVIFKMTQPVRHTAIDGLTSSVQEWAASVNWPRQHILVLPYGLDATIVPGGPPVDQEAVREDWKRVMEEKRRKRQEELEKVMEEFRK